jgi:hypothetical protein
MATFKAVGRSSQGQDTRPELDRMYGRIRISAVVAALPYKGEAKPVPPAQPETKDIPDERFWS